MDKREEGEATVFDEAAMAASPRVARAARWFRGRVGRPGFGPAMGSIAAVDYFLFLPTTTLLLASSLAMPKRWLVTGLWFAVGGALGGALLAAALFWWGPALLALVPGDVTSSPGWEGVRGIVREHGVWGLWTLALFPWAMRAGVVACALAGVPPLEVGMALLGGRLLAFPALAWAASRFPRHLQRVPAMRKFMGAAYAFGQLPAVGR